jgi:hypothetical protein
MMEVNRPKRQMQMHDLRQRERQQCADGDAQSQDQL